MADGAPARRDLLGALVLVAFTTQAGRIASADAAAPRETRPGIRFEEIGERAGVRFVHSPRKFTGREKAQVLEMFTSGGAAVAVGDFDGDGFDDLFLTDSGEGRPNHLLRNRGDLTFEEVTEAAGVGGGNDLRSIVSDALFFDFDNDGRLDLLVARFGTPLLYRNLGPGRGGGAWRFVEMSAEAGLTAFANTIAALAFDADGDGFSDLLFAHYFQPVDLLDLETRRVLPNDLDAAVNGGGLSLWRNVPGAGGRRRFVERTREAGLAHHTGWSLDLGHADLDGDGDGDLYVAVDYGTDRLFFNRGDGTFEDRTEKAIGFDTRKGMNVDVADYDRDGQLDLYVTNITDDYLRECNMLWRNGGDGTFLDVSRETATCDTDWGWGAKFADLDNDGWEDLFVANGLRSAGPEDYVPVLVERIVTPGFDFADPRSYPDIGAMTWSGYQRKRLFQNLQGSFKEIAAAAGVANEQDGRGVAVLDLDNDGRLDLVQTSAGQPTLLYRNATEGAGNWIELRLVGTRSNRDALGARVRVTAGGEVFLREVNGGNGYASQSTRRLHVGLGRAASVEAVEIRWPSGLVETISAAGERSAVPINAITRIEEGRARPARQPPG